MNESILQEYADKAKDDKGHINFVRKLNFSFNLLFLQSTVLIKVKSISTSKLSLLLSSRREL